MYSRFFSLGCSVQFYVALQYNSVLTLRADDGLLVWTPLNIQPVLLTVQVSDHMSSSLLIPILQLCSCLNGGTCQYQSVAENHLQGKFQVIKFSKNEVSLTLFLIIWFIL